jgi:hypothetical protein
MYGQSLWEEGKFGELVQRCRVVEKDQHVTWRQAKETAPFEGHLVSGTLDSNTKAVVQSRVSSIPGRAWTQPLQDLPYDWLWLRTPLFIVPIE